MLPEAASTLRSDSDETAKPRRKRRWFRFRLRTLLILMLLISLGLSWLAGRLRQRSAVAAIERCGGYVLYDHHDYDIASGRVIRLKEPSGSQFLRDLLGEDFFCNVRFVSWNKTGGQERARLDGFGDLKGVVVQGDTLTEEDIARIAGLELRSLCLHVPLSDADLAFLKTMPQLKILETGSKNTFGDAGLAHLRALSELQWLAIWARQVSDAGLANLTDLTKLEELWMCVPNISDEGLVHLQHMKGLRALAIRQANISGSGLVHLKCLPELRTLDLSGTDVDDEALTNLADFSRLSCVDLSYTRVTDSGLKHLQNVRNLYDVKLDGLELSREAVEELEQAFPHPIQIWWDPFVGRIRERRAMGGELQDIEDIATSTDDAVSDSPLE